MIEDEKFEGDKGVEVEEPTMPNSQILAPEPKSADVKSRVKRALGVGSKMTEKKWSGKPMWVCPKCRWQTFKEDRAKSHQC